MRIIGRIAAAAAVAGCAVGLMPTARGQVVQNAVKFDVSPPLSSIQQPAKAQGAFFREHRVKKIPFPSTAAAV